MLTIINVYACYAVKIYESKTKQIFEMECHTPGAPVLDPPLKKGGAFIWKKKKKKKRRTSPLHPRMLYAKFCWNWPNGSGGEDRFSINFVNLLSLHVFFNHHLNKLEFQASKDALCKVWLKLALWRRRQVCEKFTTTPTTDNGQIVIKRTHSSIRLSWVKSALWNHSVI